MDNRDRFLGLFICLAASVVEFATTADKWETFHAANPDDEDDIKRRRNYALACGVISTFICLVRLILMKVSSGVPPAVDSAFSIILLALWVFAAGFNTSEKGIYYAPDNGYFSTWAALLGAIFYCASSVTQVQNLKETEVSSQTKGFLIVMIFSLIEFSVAADQCHKQGSCEKKYAFAVAVGVVSVFFCAVQLIVLRVAGSSAETLGKVFAILLLAWWAAGAASNTSTSTNQENNGPFSSACLSANGYFATWFCLFGCVYLAFVTFVPAQAEPASNTPYQHV